MIKFNEQKKEVLTYGDVLDPIFKITEKQNALEYKRDYIEHIFSMGGVSMEEAERIVNVNIGYYAGYGTFEDRVRIEELFECSHPTFGKAAEMGRPTNEEAFLTGFKNKTLKEIRD